MSIFLGFVFVYIDLNLFGHLDVCSHHHMQTMSGSSRYLLFTIRTGLCILCQTEASVFNLFCLIFFCFACVCAGDEVVTVNTPAFAESVTEGDVRWEKGW